MTILSAVMLFVHVPRASAQVGVVDVANLGQAIYQAIENNYQHAENLIELGKQLGVSMESLENARKTLQNMKQTFSIAKNYFDAAGTVLQLYNLCEDVYEDGQTAISLIDRWRNGGKISPSQVYYAARIIKYSVKDMEELVNFVKDELFNEENHMTTAERADELQKQINRAKLAEAAARASVVALSISAQKPGIKNGEQLMADIMRSTGVSEDDAAKAEEKRQKEISEIQQIIDELANEDPSTKEAASKTLKKKVINIVALAITILTALFLGWNFGVFNHGDRQRSDVLWKVGGGYIVILVIIEVVKVVILKV